MNRSIENSKLTHIYSVNRIIFHSFELFWPRRSSCATKLQSRETDSYLIWWRILASSLLCHYLPPITVQISKLLLGTNSSRMTAPEQPQRENEQPTRISFPPNRSRAPWLDAPADDRCQWITFFSHSISMRSVWIESHRSCRLRRRDLKLYWSDWNLISIWFKKDVSWHPCSIWGIAKIYWSTWERLV